VFGVAVRGEVIVRMQWADPERNGLRTMRVQARSLDQVCRAVVEAVGPELCTNGESSPTRITDATPTKSSRRRQTNQATTTPEFQPEAHGIAAACNGHASLTNASPLVVGVVEWVGETPAGHLLPAVTLLQARAGARFVFLRVVGEHTFEVGARLYLSGLDGAQTMFDAELVSGAGKPPFFFELRSWSL
jgi:hypothetical protein